MQRDQLHICLSTLFEKPYEITPDDFDAAVDACVAAGLDGVSSWSLHHLLVQGAGRTDDELAQSLATRSLEVSWHWHWQPGGPTGANAELLAGW